MEEEEEEDFNTASHFSDLGALSVFYTVSVVSMLALALKSNHCCAKVQRAASGVFKFRMSSGNILSSLRLLFFETPALLLAFLQFFLGKARICRYCKRLRVGDRSFLISVERGTCAVYRVWYTECEMGTPLFFTLLPSCFLCKIFIIPSSLPSLPPSVLSSVLPVVTSVLFFF